MATLAMNEIPCARFDNRKHLWGDAVVTPCCPGPNTNNVHSLDHLLPGKWGREGIWHSCQKCHIDTITRKAASGFMDMRFNTTHTREVARSHHQNVKSTCCLLH